ncbi:MAG TPA: SAM-dependent methyltransferase [Solirubrobacteraceae bacterium]|jgi:SAM-dependent methyltransferase|nr:SAM-dependent methyltransferase [Solirubrobacteraceae bacterium]
MSFMTAEDFEARYRADTDPWGYLASEYERCKYAATLDACGPGPFSSALELGGSIGVFSAMLAPRCGRLVTVDVSPTAVGHARNRLAGHPNVNTIVGPIPAAVPPLPFDLVVASEILYYLSDDELTGTLSLLGDTMLAGARLVAVHWRPRGPERPRDAEQAHAALVTAPWLTSVHRGGTDDYLLEVFRR